MPEQPDEPRQPRKLLTIKDLIDRFSISRASIMRMVDEGTFPRPIKTSAQKLGWRPEDIDRWEASGGRPTRRVKPPRLKKPPKPPER